VRPALHLKPGGVCISGATYDQVRKVLPINFTDLGAQQVKNIQEPIRAYQAGAPSETREAAHARVADTAAARVLEFDPAFTISGWIAPGAQSNTKLLTEGVRKAGLPE